MVTNNAANIPTGTSGTILQGQGAGVALALSTATYPSTAGTSGKVLISDGTNIVSSTPTFPNASATSGKIIQSDGTNWLASTPTFPTTAGTSGKILISDGTNIISSTPTYPNASVTAGKVIISDGTNYIASTPTFPNTATGTGTILRADGTNWVATTATYPATTTINQILYSSSANVIAGITGANNGTLITGTTGIPSLLANGTTGQVLTATTGSPPSWGAAPGTGDVVGPGSATDNALARFDGTTGKLIQNGVITEDDTGNLSITASVSGASLAATVSNTSNTASATAHFDAIVAGGTAADAYFSSTITGGQAWTWGGDNSDSDAYVLSANAALGTTNVMRVATTGEINFPLQSAFMAYMNTAVLNVTGDGTTTYTVIFDTEVFDQNADFNLGTSTFTAPVTGRYKMNYSCGITGGTVINSSTNTMVTSNRNYTNPMPNGASATTNCSGNIAVLADFDAADTATFTVLTNDTGGKIDDVNGLVGGNLRTWASGVLIC